MYVSNNYTFLLLLVLYNVRESISSIESLLLFYSSMGITHLVSQYSTFFCFLYTWYKLPSSLNYF